MERPIDTDVQIRLIARLLDERAEELDGLVVLAVRDGRLLCAHTALSAEEREAMLQAARTAA
jgi:hypothetical protein